MPTYPFNRNQSVMAWRNFIRKSDNKQSCWTEIENMTLTFNLDLIFMGGPRTSNRIKIGLYVLCFMRNNNISLFFINLLSYAVSRIFPVNIKWQFWEYNERFGIIDLSHFFTNTRRSNNKKNSLGERTLTKKCTQLNTVRFKSE